MDVKNLKSIERKSIDLSEYDGVKAEVELVEVVDVKSNWKDGKKLPEGETISVKCLKASTKKLGEIEVKGEIKELRASELFNLTQDEDNAWGYSTNEKAKLNIFMDKMKVKTPEELVGKKVVVLIKKGFLGFNTQ